MKNKAIKFATLLVCGLTMNTAFATGGQPYIGAKVGQFSIDIKDSSLELEKPTAYGVIAGFSVDHHLGFEAEYILSNKADAKTSIGIVREFETSVLGGYASYHYHLPTAPKAYLKGKLGIAKTTIEIYNEEESETGLAGGVALGYNLTPKFSVEAEYDLLPTVEQNNRDVIFSLWTVSGHLRF